MATAKVQRELECSIEPNKFTSLIQSAKSTVSTLSMEVMLRSCHFHSQDGPSTVLLVLTRVQTTTKTVLLAKSVAFKERNLEHLAGQPIKVKLQQTAMEREHGNIQTPKNRKRALGTRCHIFLATEGARRHRMRLRNMWREKSWLQGSRELQELLQTSASRNTLNSV